MFGVYIEDDNGSQIIWEAGFSTREEAERGLALDSDTIRLMGFVGHIEKCDPVPLSRWMSI